MAFTRSSNLLDNADGMLHNLFLTCCLVFSTYLLWLLYSSGLPWIHSLVVGVSSAAQMLHGTDYQLRRTSLTEYDAFAFLKADSDGDYITYTGFCEALRQEKYEEILRQQTQIECEVNQIQAYYEAVGEEKKREYLLWDLKHNYTTGQIYLSLLIQMLHLQYLLRMLSQCHVYS